MHAARFRGRFQLHDRRESKVWREVHEEGIEKGREEVVSRMQAKGMTLKAIAELLDITLPEVRRLGRAGK